jgi:hypothetical protein
LNCPSANVAEPQNARHRSGVAGGKWWRVIHKAAYLSHAHVTDTYWYLQATPVLMGQIAEAGEALLAGGAA